MHQKCLVEKESFPTNITSMRVILYSGVVVVVVVVVVIVVVIAIVIIILVVAVGGVSVDAVVVVVVVVVVRVVDVKNDAATFAAALLVVTAVVHCSDVDVHVTLARELFTAHLACVRFFKCMDTKMNSEVALPTETARKSTE